MANNRSLNHIFKLNISKDTLIKISEDIGADVPFFINGGAALIAGKGEIINIASGKLISVEEIAKTVGGEITFLPSRDYEVDDHLADVSKAKKILNNKGISCKLIKSKDYSNFYKGYYINNLDIKTPS